MASDFVEAGKVVLEYATRPRYSFVIWIVCLLLLILPECGIDVFVRWKDGFTDYIWLIWLVMFITWIVEMGILLSNKYLEWRSEKAKEKETLAYVETLSYHEARLLVGAVERNSQTITARKDMDEGFCLCQKGLVKPVNIDGKTGLFGGVPYLIPTFVWEHINKPDVLAALQAMVKKEQPA